MWPDKHQMRAAGRSGRTLHAANVTIVGVVVLLNSIAWGVPLLSGTSPTAEALVAGEMPPASHSSSALSTGAVTLPVTPGLTPARTAPGVPLPGRAPEARVPEAGPAAGPEAGEVRTVAPRTLYPRPDPAPERLLAPPPMPDAEPAARAPSRIAAAEPDTSRDVALVSPYAPGVRITPRPGDAAQSQALAVAPTPYRLESDTTLERARRIAQRATERFEEVRTLLEGYERASQTAAAEDGARAPVASLLGSTRAARSLGAELRPSVVRRPIPAEARTATASTAPAAPPAEPIPALDRPATPAVVAPPVRVARLAQDADDLAPPSPGPAPAQATAALSADGTVKPPAPARSPFALARAEREPPATSQARPASPRTRRDAEPSRSRIVRRHVARRDRREAQRRSRPRKIDGFRPDFHRQLVSANFFGGSQR